PNNIGIFHAMEVGQASQQNFVDAIRKLASKPQNITDQQIIDAWNLLLLPFDYTRFELLDRLRENYKIILLSNTNKVHHDYWVPKFDRENPFARSFNSYFDHIFYSDELQLRKPEREIYETVQQIAQISPLTTLFIDDTAPNLVEPQKMGWNVHHLLKPQTVFDLFI
ncbi:MAG: HAD-IA family hydrolase, partial [Mucinivorans sp.]